MSQKEMRVHDRELESAPQRYLRAGVRVSAMSLGWTVAASTAAVLVGITKNSLVLLAFGLTSLLDTIGSAAILVHFRHSLHNESFSDRHERMALRVVIIGLYMVGAATLGESVRRFFIGTHSDPAFWGAILAAVSAAVLAVLAVWKRRIARAVPSRALLTDSLLSATAALLAAITLVGAGTAVAFGWWWVDHVAASAVAVVAMTIASALWRGRVG